VLQLPCLIPGVISERATCPLKRDEGRYRRTSHRSHGPLRVERVLSTIKHVAPSWVKHVSPAYRHKTRMGLGGGVRHTLFFGRSGGTSLGAPCVFHPTPTGVPGPLAHRCSGWWPWPQRWVACCEETGNPIMAFYRPSFFPSGHREAETAHP